MMDLFRIRDRAEIAQMHEEQADMSTRATGTLEGKAWDEQPYNETPGELKLTRASVRNAFHGAIEGEGTLEYLMVYTDESRAGFVGLERVVGRLDGRAGSFVLQHGGTFVDGAATVTWSVLPDSGTGDLRGLRGSGGFVAQHGDTQVSYTLDYELA